MILCGVVASLRQFHGEPKQCKVFVRTEIDARHMQTVSELAFYSFLISQYILITERKVSF
jgi:hypothetical protein